MLPPSRILILAPHTDDGELGCGGSMARFAREGKDVFYAAFSLCHASLPEGWPPGTLEQECKKATSFLGVKTEHLFLFDFAVRKFSAQRQEILETMVRLEKDLQPDLVLMPSAFDQHQDHSVIYEEGLRAFKKNNLLGYEQPWNQARSSAEFFIKLTEEDVNKKTEALQFYQSQRHRSYMQEDFIKSLARVRGVQAHAAFAEAFEVYRLIE
jgi:LmbE family N-acetylglucosaminyl deacetylase